MSSFHLDAIFPIILTCYWAQFPYKIYLNPLFIFMCSKTTILMLKIVILLISRNVPIVWIFSEACIIVGMKRNCSKKFKFVWYIVYIFIYNSYYFIYFRTIRKILRHFRITIISFFLTWPVTLKEILCKFFSAIYSATHLLFPRWLPFQKYLTDSS